MLRQCKLKHAPITCEIPANFENLIGLGTLNTAQIRLITGPPKEKADASTAPGRKDSACDGIQPKCFTETIEIVPSPYLLVLYVHIIERGRACLIQAVFLEPGERSATGGSN